MSMHYEDLDARTRELMLLEFEAEERSGPSYRCNRLSESGRTTFPELMRNAICEGTERSLTESLLRHNYWRGEEEYERNGVVRVRKLNLRQVAEQVGLCEFSTWYVRGLARRLMDEGILDCQVYRGTFPKWEPGECAVHENQIVPVRLVYEGHRARYWPKPGRPEAFSIPFTPGCHHVIRRVQRVRTAV